MSREARDWVWNDAPVNDPRKLLILLSLADVADEFGSGAYPSKARLARDSRSDERTVQRHLGAMIKDGLLQVEEKANQHRPTTYGMPAVRGDNLSPLEPPRGDTGETNGESSPLYGTGSNSAPEDRTRGFDVFWESYPRRKGERRGKKVTREKWAKLPLDDKRAAYRGLPAYAARAGEFPKDPERYLTGRLWEDDYQPPEAAEPERWPGEWVPPTEAATG